MIYVYRAVLVSRLCPVEISLTRRIITTCWHKRDNYEFWGQEFESLRARQQASNDTYVFPDSDHVAQLWIAN